MSKGIVYTIATVICIAIGLFQISRINKSYFTPESTIPQQQTKTDSVIVDTPFSLENNISILPDSILQTMTEEQRQQYFNTIENLFRQNQLPSPEQTEQTSTSSSFVPSFFEKRVQFWIDILISLISAVSPVLIPFFMYRKTKLELEEEELEQEQQNGK